MASELPPPWEESELPLEDQVYRRNIDKVLAKGLTIWRPNRTRDDNRCFLKDRDGNVVGEGDHPDPNTSLVQAAKDYAQRMAEGIKEKAA